MNDKKKQKIDSVDQIRDILFGEQVALIEDRFVKLEKNLTTAIDKLSGKVEVSNKDLKKQIDESNKKMTSDSSNLAEEQSVAINGLETTIQNKIVEMESELLNQIQAGLQKLDEKASHRKDLARLLKEMADKLAE